MLNQLNNPAARLMVIIEKARSISRDTLTYQAWATLTGADPRDTAAILLGISDFIQLAFETKQAIEELDGHDRGLYLEPIEKVLSLFTTFSFASNWASTIDRLDPVTIYGLRACSDLLSGYSREQPVDDLVIEDLVIGILDLQREVLESNLPPELKSFLFEHLERVRLALAQYKLFGTKRLKAALESFAGAAIFQNCMIKPFWDDAVVRKVWELLSKVATAVTLSQGFQMLSDGMTRLVGSGNP